MKSTTQTTLAVEMGMKTFINKLRKHGIKSHFNAELEGNYTDTSLLTENKSEYSAPLSELYISNRL